MAARLIRCRWCGAAAPAESPREAAEWHLDHACTAAGPPPPAHPIVVLATGANSVVTK
jgi:hypothetical protein